LANYRNLSSSSRHLVNHWDKVKPRGVPSENANVSVISVGPLPTRKPALSGVTIDTFSIYNLVPVVRDIIRTTAFYKSDGNNNHRDTFCAISIYTISTLSIRIYYVSLNNWRIFDRLIWLYTFRLNTPTDPYRKPRASIREISR